MAATTMSIKRGLSGPGSGIVARCLSGRNKIPPFSQPLIHRPNDKSQQQPRRSYHYHGTYSWSRRYSGVDKIPRPEPDGGRLVDLVAPEEKRAALQAEAADLPAVRIRPVDLQWLHVLADGWASPLKGFMRRFEYVQALNFKALRIHPHGLPVAHSMDHRGSVYVNMSIPIVLPIAHADKVRIHPYGKIDFEPDVALLRPESDDLVAIVRRTEIQSYDKKSLAVKTWGERTLELPYVKEVISPAGDWLIGGDLDVVERIRYDDGLDQYRLSPRQLRAEFDRRNADAVYAFHLKGPLNNGHALALEHSRNQLLRMHKNPILLVHVWPYTASTDEHFLPLPVLMEQYSKVLEDGVLDPATTVTAIFPSPLNYVGQNEVQWHAKALTNAGVNFYIVNETVDRYYPGGTDIYFDLAPGLEKICRLHYYEAAYDKQEKIMGFPITKRFNDFLFISDSELRNYAAKGENPPHGIMSPSAWEVLNSYFKSLKADDPPAK